MNRLKYFRKKYNIKSDELASKLGVSRQTISAWENGTREIPENRKKELARLFETDIRSFEETTESDSEKIQLLVETRHSDINGGNEHILAYMDKLAPGSLNAAFLDKQKAQRELEKQIHDSFAGPSDASLRKQISYMDRGISLYEHFLNIVNLLNDQERSEQMLYYYRIMEFLMGMEKEMGSIVDIKKYQKGKLFDIDDRSVETARKLFSDNISESKQKMASVKTDMDYMLEMIIDKSAKGLDVTEDVEKLNRNMLDNGVAPRKEEEN